MAAIAATFASASFSSPEALAQRVVPGGEAEVSGSEHWAVKRAGADNVKLFLWRKQLNSASIASGRVDARRGTILNVASGAAFLPSPTLTVYAATKAYVVSFTQGLAEETKRDGVKVAVVCPGFTRTEFQERAQYNSGNVPGFAWQTPQQVVEESLAALRAGKLICIPGIGNKVTMQLINLIPRSAIAGLAGRFTARH